MKALAIEKAKVLKALIELNKISKIIDTFIPIFKNKTIPKQDKVYLHGSFNLGGTISGRLSSSNPNMQQIPSSGSKYAKPIKKCFSAPEGWLLCSADFNALEAKINALLTKDPNKLKVYSDGFDSHSFNTYIYWKDKFPYLDPNKPKDINSIADTNKPDRQNSKAVTFALQFFGTYRTLMNNSGFSEKEAKQIVANYETAYKVSMDWVNEKLKQAAKDGYANGAFGLRIRTPIMKQVIWGSSKMPYEAAAESRTAGNAISGQSYGLLTNRAQNEFLARVAASKHRLDIQPIAAIHDALYFLVKEDAETVKFLNDNLIDCMEWQADAAIEHPTVKLGAELCIHYPTWADEIKISNKASLDQIQEVTDAITDCITNRKQ